MGQLTVEQQLEQANKERDAAVAAQENKLLSFLGGVGGAGAAGLAAYYGKQQGQEDLGLIGQQLSPMYDAITSGVQSSAEFKPFTVTSGAGTGSFTDGQLSLSPSSLQTGLQGQAQSMLGNVGSTANVSGLQNQAFTGAGTALGMDSGAFASSLGGMYGAMGENQINQAGVPSNLAALQNQFAQQGMSQQSGSLGGLTGQLQQAASGAFGGATPTAQSVYDQIRATQSPEEERQRIALENRLAAQGRLGVQTDMYGGTPEQFAMDKAQAEARNSASLQAMSMADQLATSQQSRASQLAQLGMSAEQIDSQLASEGLARQAQSVGLAGSLAQTGAGISAQQQQLGQGLLGLGLEAQQLGGSLGAQDIANAASMFGIGQQATTMPYQEQALQLGNIQSALTASGIPLEQQLAATGMGLTAQQQELERQQQYANLLANLGLSETGLMKDLALSDSTLTQEYIKSLGNIGAGLAGIEF